MYHVPLYSQQARDFHERATHPQLAQGTSKRKLASTKHHPSKRSKGGSPPQRHSQTPAAGQHSSLSSSNSLQDLPPSEVNRDSSPPAQTYISANEDSSLDVSGHPEDEFTLHKTRERVFEKNSAREVTFDVSINKSWVGRTLDDIQSNIGRVMEAVLERVKGLDSDLVKVCLHHDSLYDPIVVSLREWSEMSAETILQEVDKVCQSHKGLEVDMSFKIQVGLIHKQPGAGRPAVTKIGPGGSLQRKTSSVEIKSDNMCQARAIGVCWLQHHHMETADFTRWCASRGVRWPYRRGDERFEFVMEHKKCSKALYKNCIDGSSIQTDLANWLCVKAGVDKTLPGNVDTIHKFEDFLGFKIYLSLSMEGNKMATPKRAIEDRRPSMFLYLAQGNAAEVGHYHAFSKMNTIFGAKAYCEYCLVPYDKLHEHKCEYRCYQCKRVGCRVGGNFVMSCRSCHISFKNSDCFKVHRLPLKKKQTEKNKPEEWEDEEEDEEEEVKGEQESHGKTLCQIRYKCGWCEKVMQRRHQDPADHVCGEWKCRNCKVFVDDSHRCYMRALDKKSPTATKKWLIFDFESTQDVAAECVESYTPRRDPGCLTCTDTTTCSKCRVCTKCAKTWCGRKEHIPNFCICLKICEDCKDEPLVQLDPSNNKHVWKKTKCHTCGDRCERCVGKVPCQGCGYRERLFAGPDTAEEFIEYILDLKHKGITALAHNLGNYDGYFVLEHLMKHPVKPDVVFSGGKIMKIHIRGQYNITFLDTLLFMPLPLAKLAQTFGVPELKKGRRYFYEMLTF